MSELDLSLTPEQVQAALSFDCPKCGIEVSMVVAKDLSLKPTCIQCGWSATFSLKVSF